MERRASLKSATEIHRTSLTPLALGEGLGAELGVGLRAELGVGLWAGLGAALWADLEKEVHVRWHSHAPTPSSTDSAENKQTVVKFKSPSSEYVQRRFLRSQHKVYPCR